MTFESFQQIIDEARPDGKRGIIVPVTRRLTADLLTPVLALLRLRHDGRSVFLFESVEGGEKLARFSFLGRDPFAVIEGRGTGTAIRYHGDFRPFDFDENATVIQNMRKAFDGYTEIRIPEMPRFAGGAVGYLGYDGVRLFERVPESSPKTLDVPDAVWSFYRSVVAFDHLRHQLVLIANAYVDAATEPETVYREAIADLDRLEDALTRADVPMPGPFRHDERAQSAFDRADFESAVVRAKHLIKEGDIFQVVLSRRASYSFTGDAVQLYRALRRVNPSPYLFYVETDSCVLIGSSPEVLVRTEGSRAEVLPIAGTRPRGATPEEDARLEEELLADPKERAEHVMLVDLGRNDLGRVCEPGSVDVERYAFVERYSHVMHIVSSVSGRLVAGSDALHTLAACFPAGTVSGAPKVRAMEIIDELEPEARGVYAGAVGYIDFAGNMDTCIAIRTMVVKDDRVYLQAGAGIVADSVPEAEFQETENKVGALREALRLASHDLKPAGADETTAPAKSHRQDAVH